MNEATNHTTFTPSATGHKIVRLVPMLRWLRHYTRADFGSDLFAGIITAILLVPQGIAFALLAGMPPVTGLYASVLPPVVYAVLGTSRTMSVGPVSVASIMVASALSSPELKDQGDYLGNALILALESGVMLLLMSGLRMGTLVNFISHPVLTGFTSGAAIMIIGSQLLPFTGLRPSQCLEYLDGMACLRTYWQGLHGVTSSLGIASMVLLWFFNKPIVVLLRRLGLNPTTVTGISKSGPLLVVLLTTLLITSFDLKTGYGVATVGQVPSGLPHIHLGFLRLNTWWLLLSSAFFISLVGYVESVAIAKYTASLRRQRIDANQELVALGAANIVAAFTGAMPVAGGFSRTMVNFAAGAKTQMATLITAGLLAIAVAFFTPWFANIPKTTLAAIILIAILPLVKLQDIVHTWRYQRADGIAEVVTLIGVLVMGIEGGIGLGILLTLLCYLWRTSRPHIAVVGRVPHTEHYRNVCRHQVQTWPEVILFRVDENLTFANAGFVEDFIIAQLVQRPDARHLVLICTAINHIDATALDTLETIAESLRSNGLTLHLAEVKGPVMDALQRVNFLEVIAPGRVFFTTDEAVNYLTAWGREG